MDDFQKQLTAALNKASTVTNHGAVLAQRIQQYGLHSVLATTFVNGAAIAPDTQGYSASDFGTAINTEQIPVIYGQVMITGSVVNGGTIRSDLDPSQIQKVVQFITGEGPVQGIAGVDASKLQNVYVNGQPVASSSGSSSSSGFGLKEVAGIAAPALALAAAPYVTKLLGLDPATNLPIKTVTDGLSQLQQSGKLGLNNVSGMNVSSSANNMDVIVFDKPSQKWVNKPFVDVHKASGITIEPLKVQQNGSQVDGDFITLNFAGTGVTVADAGNRTATITINSSTGSGGTGGTGGTGGSTSPCKYAIPVTQEPQIGMTYTLLRNGYAVSFVNISSNVYGINPTTKKRGLPLPSRRDIAWQLAGATNPVSVWNYSLSGPPGYTPPDSNGNRQDYGNDDLATVNISAGWEPCVGCQTAVWTITPSDPRYAGSVDCSPINPVVKK